MKNRFIIDDTERQSILEMHRRAILKETINEKSAPKGWENYPCVPKHPNATAIGEGYSINGDMYYKDGTKRYKPGNTEMDTTKDTTYTCNDPVFKVQTNPKTNNQIQTVPSGWKNYPCVPRHPKATRSDTGNVTTYSIPNGKGGQDVYYPEGTKITGADERGRGSGVSVKFTCNDPIFQGQRKFPKTEEDLLKPGYYLKVGDRGPLVQKLQKLLYNAAEGYSTQLSTNKNKKPNFTPFDGIFGPTTKSVVQEFQKDEQLKSVNGIVGPETWDKLKDIRLKYDWDVANQTNIDTEKNNEISKMQSKTATQIPLTNTTT
jgi:hypothetical protein